MLEWWSIRFNLEVPQSVPGVPSEVLNPRNTWSNSSAYDEQARKLAQMFVDNFKSFEAEASADGERRLPVGHLIVAAGEDPVGVHAGRERHGGGRDGTPRLRARGARRAGGRRSAGQRRKL